MNSKILLQAKNFALVALGTLVLAMGTALFILPNNLLVGGVSTIAIIISELLGGKFLSLEMLITILTVTFFVIGLIFLGVHFALKTLISSIFYPLGIALFTYMSTLPFFAQFLGTGQNGASETAILSALFGGVFIGTGCAMAFLGGGSTGGVDIIAFIIVKYIKGLTQGTAVFIIDGTLIFLGLLVSGNLTLALLGVFSAFITATVIDKIFVGRSRALIAHIISEKTLLINQRIQSELLRSSSIVPVEGGYSGKFYKMLLVTFSMSQYRTLLDIVHTTDPSAFLIITPAHQIYGYGWTQ